jgi:DNA-binding MarR family transcriptional regulator
VALTAEGRALAEGFYDETCRRVELLPTGLDDDDRATLADLLGRLVLENKVPVVFMEWDEGAARH